MAEHPAWDGRGVDPWLPYRLDARLEVAATERSIRDAFWAELSAWLVATARRVLRGQQQRPDTDAVLAGVPEWRGAVDRLLAGEIREAVGIAFRRIFGAGYRWEQRAFVVQYLAEVRNRLMRVPDEVYDRVAAGIAEGVNLGESIPQLAARVAEIFSLTGTPHWSNRATVTARTEAIGALNAGRHEAFRAVAEDPEIGGTFEQVWIATEDSRTRETHALADGQRQPLGQPFQVGGFALRFPGDPMGPPQEVIQCRCTSILVEPGEFVDLSGRQMR